MRILIVDDESLARAGLRQLVERHPDAVVVGTASTGAEALLRVADSAPDVILLDVEMPGLDGFGVLASLELGKKPFVVFVTAHRDFAARAFDVEAVDYLVKPFSDERFDSALERMRRRLAVEKVPRSQIVLRIGDRRVVVNVEHVTHLSAESYYAAVHVLGRSYLLRESLDDLEEQLDATTFVRIHRSSIVNLRFVKEIRRDRAGELLVVMEHGETLRVARARRASLEARLSHR